MADDFVNRAMFGGQNMSTIPISTSVNDSTSTSLDSTIKSVGDSAQGARDSAVISDKVVQDVLKSVIPFQGDMGQIIQNRPQVMLPTPIRPKQMPMGVPTNQVHATTAAGQRRNDLQSLISSVGNIVKAGVNKKREKEDRDLMADLAIIQAASANPSDPHNQKILDTIASDPKKVKRLQNALGYNPLSGEPPSPETQTMMKYGAESQRKQQVEDIKNRINDATINHSYGQRTAGQAIGQGEGAYPGAMGNLFSRSPNTPQINPVVAIQGELIKAGIMPKADTSLRAMTDLIKEAMTNDTKLKEIEEKAKASNNRVLLGLANSIRAAQTHIETTRMHEAGATEREKIRAGASKDVANIRAQSAYERYKARYGDEKAKNLDKLIKDVDADIKNLDVQIAAEKDKTKLQALKDQQAAKKAQKSSLEDLMGFRDAQVPDSPANQLLNSTKPPSTKEMDDVDTGTTDDDNMDLVFR